MEQRRALYVRIPADLWPKLRALAEVEFRSPKEQASILLIDAVERRYGRGRTAKGGDQP